MNNYKIYKNLNNNVVLAKDSRDQKWILFGKGIGFPKRDLNFLNDKDVENKYALFDCEKLSQYEKLLAISSNEATMMSEYIISEMKKTFGDEYNEYIHISLLDHLNFTLKRMKGNIIIKNLFEDELASIYPKEYEFSLNMVNKIREKIKIELPLCEVGMICMHIHSALHGENVSNTALIINIVSYVLKYLEDTYSKVNEPLFRNRLIIHLKFAIKRAIEKVPLNNDLIDIVKTNYPIAYDVSKTISNKIDKKFYILIDESEVAYLAIHLQNIFHFSN